jgi:integrase/recombinase XerC
MSSTAPSVRAFPRQTVPNSLVLVREWDRYLEANGRSPETRRGYRYQLLRFLAETCPADLAKVTEADVTGYMTTIGGQGPTRRLAALSLRSFFKWAVEGGELPHDPTVRIRPKKPARPVPAALSRDELTRLLYAAADRNERQAWALMLSYALGARRMELCGIRPEDVDLEAGMVHLVRTKGGKPRSMEIGPLALAALEGLRPWGRETVLGVGASTVNGWMKRASVLAGLSKAKQRQHALRATFATNVLASGTPISVVSVMLGHSDLAITTWYLAVNEEDRRRAVEAL